MQVGRLLEQGSQLDRAAWLRVGYASSPARRQIRAGLRDQPRRGAGGVDAAGVPGEGKPDCPRGANAKALEQLCHFAKDD